MHKRTILCVATTFFFIAGTAGAQTTLPRATEPTEALINLLIAPLGVSPGRTASESFFIDTAASITALNTFNAEIATFPLGSSSGGFSWTFDPALGVPTRRSNSFGPMFAERPLTNGRQKLNIAFAYQHTKFDSIGGQSLSNLLSSVPLKTTTGVTVGTINAESNAELSIDRATISASYGVTDRIDVGVVVPFGRTRVVGTSQVRFLNLQGAQVNSILQLANEDVSSSGVGDVVLRGKFTVPTGETFSKAFNLSAGVNLRLPTGDAHKLLGVGCEEGSTCAPAVTVMAMGSMNRGTVAPHFNIGYTFAGKDGFFDTTDEVNYIFGADVAATPVLTIAGDVIGRALRGAYVVDYITRADGTVGFASNPGTPNLLLGAVGVKYQVYGQWLVTGSILFPLNDAGVRPGITPVIGFERAF